MNCSGIYLINPTWRPTEHMVEFPIAELTVQFGGFQGQCSVVVPSWDGDVFGLVKLESGYFRSTLTATLTASWLPVFIVKTLVLLPFGWNKHLFRNPSDRRWWQVGCQSISHLESIASVRSFLLPCLELSFIISPMLYAANGFMECSAEIVSWSCNIDVTNELIFIYMWR